MSYEPVVVPEPEPVQIVCRECYGAGYEASRTLGGEWGRFICQSCQGDGTELVDPAEAEGLIPPAGR